MAVLQERIISGRGILQLDISAADFRLAKGLIVYAQVFRNPSNISFSKNWNPRKSFYGALTFLKDGYVTDHRALEFDFSRFSFLPDKDYQSVYALICAYEGILQSFANLGTALGVLPISVVNEILGFEHVDFLFDTIKAVCFADTAIKLSVVSVPFEFCSQLQNVVPQSVDPVAMESPVDSGTSLLDAGVEVSPPYDGVDDNGDTVPFPGDAEDLEGFDFPIGNDCQVVQISIQKRFVGIGPNEGSTIEDVDVTAVYGPVTDAVSTPAPFSSGTQFSTIIDCRGVVGQTFCTSPGSFEIDGGIISNFNAEIYEVISIVPQT